MSASLEDILSELETLAEYAGPWRALRQEQPLLRVRLAELREREARRNDVLVVAIVGGSGVGKSTLLNAIAGDEIAKMSEMRPCTTEATVYHPPGAPPPIEGCRCVARSALEHLAIVDTPDTDSIALEHRERTLAVLQKCDLILLCGTAEKYLDEATWALLRPLQGERAMICVETKAGADDAIREHWLGHLAGQGFQIAEYFRVRALRSLDRKLHGGAPTAEELDFPRLEAYFAEELTKERIARIKRSNVSGLLAKTVGQLHTQLTPKEQGLQEVAAQLDAMTQELAAQCGAAAEARLFQEGHLWHLALGREVSLRAKGIVGGCARLLELVRSLPARMAGLLPRLGRPGGGAAAQFDGPSLFEGEIAVIGEEAASHFGAAHSRARLALARAGFDPLLPCDTPREFQEGVADKLRAVLRGPAQEAVTRRARMVTSWPATLLLDAPLLAFFAYATWVFTRHYFGTGEVPPAFFQNSAIMFFIILAAELFLLSLAFRWLAWSARKAAAKAFHGAFAADDTAFPQEAAVVEGALEQLQRVRKLHTELRQE